MDVHEARRLVAAVGERVRHLGRHEDERPRARDDLLVVDDLEAMVSGLPPRRLQVAEPELATRYVRTTTLVDAARAAR